MVNGRKIAELRRSHGWTQSFFADRIGFSVETVKKLERNARESARLSTLSVIADALSVPLNVLLESSGSVAPSDESAALEIASPLSRGIEADDTNSNVYQIERLRQDLNDTISLGAMTEAALEDWEQTAIIYARATRDRPVGVLLSDIGNDLAELKRVLGQHHSTSAMRRLTRVTAQMSGLICLIFCILDDRSAFRRWARTARFAANEAGDPETLSWILAQEAYGHYYSGDRLEAIDVARRAYDAVRTPCTGAALAAALEARTHATMGRNQEAREALARAERTLSQLDGEVLIPSAFGYNEASFRFHQGNAYTHLRDVKAAFKAQERALELGKPEDYTDWGMTQLDRAQCLIYSGEVTTGLEYATDAIVNLTARQRHGIITLRAREIIEALPEGGKKLAAARDLREILMFTNGISEVES